ncbi:hypothetical protein AGLY_009434 [Aphis glycines]|uniref:Uncharacterized protein n=1 Tax=Aphis glycines TaxID=307491 RepID=A0A6G0THF9_APHGL|nr:hypothetical protein AGLY_009434 [Aphis glycines]
MLLEMSKCHADSDLSNIDYHIRKYVYNYIKKCFKFKIIKNKDNQLEYISSCNLFNTIFITPLLKMKILILCYLVIYLSIVSCHNKLNTRGEMKISCFIQSGIKCTYNVGEVEQPRRFNIARPHRKVLFSSQVNTIRVKIASNLSLRTTYGKSCIIFQNLEIKRKLFINLYKNHNVNEFCENSNFKCLHYSYSKVIAQFYSRNNEGNEHQRLIPLYPTIKTTHQEPCIKFSKIFGHPKIFYRHFKKNFSKKSKISVVYK